MTYVLVECKLCVLGVYEICCVRVGCLWGMCGVCVGYVWGMCGVCVGCGCRERVVMYL